MTNASSRSSAGGPEGVAMDLDEVKAVLTQAEDEARNLIRAHPIACLAGAVAIGFLISRSLKGD